MQNFEEALKRYQAGVLRGEVRKLLEELARCREQKAPKVDVRFLVKWKEAGLLRRCWWAVTGKIKGGEE